MNGPQRPAVPRPVPEPEADGDTPTDRSGSTRPDEPAAAPAGVAGTACGGAGDELGGYRLLRELGRGGMGAVFEAEDPKLRRRVALKVMLAGPAGDGPGRERFLREARSAAAVEHDHVVPIYQVGEDRGTPYLVMRLLPGESLAARLAREGRLSAAEVASLGRQAALGLAAAHEKGVTHRDVKPANLWVEPDGRVRVLDFGLARAADAEELTRPGCAVGTPEYMAPEQVRGRRAGPKADLFALGAVLYRAATGVSPFRRDSAYGSMRAVEKAEVADPLALRPDLPPPLAEAIVALLAKKPADRPPSAAAVAEIFEGVARAVGGPSGSAALGRVPGAAAPGDSLSLPAAPTLPPVTSPRSGGSGRPGRRPDAGRRAAGRSRPGTKGRRWLAALAVAATASAGIAAFVFLRGDFRTGPAGEATARADDPLPTRSRWEGRFEFLPPVEFTGDASLSVEGRQGDRFTGTYGSERGAYAWRVRGRVDDGRIFWEFVEAVRDNPAGDVVGRATVEGTLAGGVIDATWRQGEERARIELRRAESAVGTAAGAEARGPR